jgi:hypothetical protein
VNSAALPPASLYEDESIGLPLPATIALAALLVPLSGLFAGLTLGLLSLDLVGLRVRRPISRQENLLINFSQGNGGHISSLHIALQAE